MLTTKVVLATLGRIAAPTKVDHTAAVLAEVRAYIAGWNACFGWRAPE